MLLLHDLPISIRLEQRCGWCNSSPRPWYWHLAIAFVRGFVNGARILAARCCLVRCWLCLSMCGVLTMLMWWCV